MCNVFQKIHSSNIWSLASFQICTCCCHLYNRKHAVSVVMVFFYSSIFFANGQPKSPKHVVILKWISGEFNIINKSISICFKTSFEQHNYKTTAVAHWKKAKMKEIGFQHGVHNIRACLAEIWRSLQIHKTLAVALISCALWTSQKSASTAHQPGTSSRA